MSVTAIHNFEHAVHVANEWIKDLAAEPEVGSESQAYTILRVVLHALRDRLRVDEVAHLAAQLPMLVRGFFYEGWKPPHDELRLPEDSEQFFQSVAESLLPVSEIEAEDAVYLVYALLARRFSPGELVYAQRALPYDLVMQWKVSVPSRALD